ncbi:hypothetical protein HanOQP8_Chr10g0371651 [Helianthus annuus]|nr:hypothetical protein HanOQP8_Chr10g0371651 [Helianthus annuus]KAJ0884356.1 hypothetical protein HanPSC8_Chr10g0432771 [Helianthus annuus]
MLYLIKNKGSLWVYALWAWNMKGWLNKSKSGSSNSKSGDINGRSSRHTGGSMGFDEHRENWRGYLEAMHELHGLDLTDCPDDPEVWARVQPEGHRTTRPFGVDSSDLHYMMSGTSSSSSGCAPSSIEYQRSLEEVSCSYSIEKLLGSVLLYVRVLGFVAKLIISKIKTT